MATYTLERGLVIHNGKAQWQVQRVLDQKHVQLENTDTGQIRRERLAKLTADITSGKLQVVRNADTASNDGRPHNNRQLVCTVSLPEHHQLAYERAYGYVRYMRRRGITKGQRARIDEAITCHAAATNDKSRPSASTVMLWMRIFEASGENPGSLVSGNAHRRRSLITPGSIREIIQTMLKRHYFTRDGSTLRTVHDYVMHALNRASTTTGDDVVAMVSLSTIRRIAQEVTPYDRDRLRLGPAQARAKWRFSKPGAYASRPLERVEMDHTTLDIWVIDDRLGIPLGRPTITLLVCSYSAYILGFFVSFEGETVGRLIQAIKQAIQPKDAITANASLTNPWYAMGLWETLVVDNAPSFHSPHFQHIAIELGMDVEYCPVRMPWFKPVVERHLGDLTRQLPKHGRPQKPGRSPDPADPRTTACLTFSELCLGILQWIVDVHPFEINQRKLARPVDLFLDGLESCPAPRFIENFDSLDVMAGMATTVTVDHGGVVLKWLRYTSDELGQMRREIGSKFRTAIKFNPYDLGNIFVQHPRSRTWVSVPARDLEYAAGLSLTQHRMIRASAQKNLTAANAAIVLREARVALQERWAAAIHSGRKIKRGAHELGRLQGLSSTSLSSSSNPLSISDPAARLITDEESVEPDRPIPSFETFSGELP